DGGDGGQRRRAARALPVRRAPVLRPPDPARGLRPRPAGTPGGGPERVSLRRQAAAGVIAALLGMGLVAAAGGEGSAAADCYADTVDRTLQAVRDIRGDDREAARRAADGLEACTGQSQREILLDLRQDPPNVADARDRLTALSRAARSPAFAPE